MTPLYYHAAFEAYANKTVSYIPSAEIQIPRGVSKGRLDLALVGRKHIELIELKASSEKLFGQPETIINKIRAKQLEAKMQLEQIDHDEIFESTELYTEDLAIVTLFLLVPQNKISKGLDVNSKVKATMKEIEKKFSYALRASLIYSKTHKINLDSSKAKDEQAVGMIVVASRAVDIN